ncbi:MAG: aminoglycoside phosphotransferase family protein [Acidobacteriota bacterium]|nr:aminoglycoside phosphotransferase family protein [Acidobacteriota bacterium]
MINKNFTANLPEHFRKNTLDLCRKLGEQWLNDLPRIIGELEETWSLKVEKPFPNLSYNFVAPCAFISGAKAVLKIALPLNNPEIFNEANFLNMADGKGAVRLLKFDKNHRAILLEQLTPGKHLKEVCQADEKKAVKIAIKILSEILKKPSEDSAFLRLEDWFKGFDGAAKTTFPREYISRATEFYEELSCSPHKFLIHGDLHHENILSATRKPFLAIDPKGIIGDVGYEIAVFLNNHLWWLASDANLKEKLNNAVQQFSEAFEIEPRDLRKWAFAQIILSAWWTFDEIGENWERELALAEFWEV